MEHSEIEINQAELFACLAAVWHDEKTFAYAVLSPSLQMIRKSAAFDTLVAEPGQPDQTSSLFDLPEFFGLEEEANAVSRHKLPRLTVERVNRTGSDNIERYLSFQLLPLGKENGRRGLLLIVQDETAAGNLEQEIVQERNELSLAKAELERLNKIKFVFMSMIVHDLRTPLSAVYGFAELIPLIDQNLSETALDYLERIRAQSLWMNQNINDILLLDQLDNGIFELQKEQVNLAELIEQTVQIVEPNLKFYDQPIVYDQPIAPVMVNIDSRRMRQVIFNLLSNASKYSDKERPIAIRLAATKQGAQVEVQDQGYGMSKDELKRLFQLYYRTEEAKKGKKTGTGLGLYIVKCLVEAHHGQVWVESEKGKGSTFYVWLPAE